MPEASAKGQKQKSSAIEIWTAVVLTITMVAVIWYTWEADRQNEFNQRIIETASRPYLAITAHEQGFSTSIFSASAGGAIAVVPFYVVNHGKLPAHAQIKSAVAYSQTRIPNIDGIDGAREKHRFIFSETSGDALVAVGREALTPGQLADIQNGIGFIYLAVDLKYGNYYTRICEEFPIAAAQDGAQGAKLPARLGAYSLCADPRSNDAN
jgi:hypothetical protein